MSIVFLDTNIIVDALGARVPYLKAAMEVFTLADNKDIQLVCSAISIVNADYLLKKTFGNAGSLRKLAGFRTLCGIISVTENCIDKALQLQSDFPDFEHAVQYFTATESGASVILSRDVKGFRNSQIPVLTAEEFIRQRSLV